LIHPRQTDRKTAIKFLLGHSRGLLHPGQMTPKTSGKVEPKIGDDSVSRSSSIRLLSQFLARRLIVAIA